MNPASLKQRVLARVRHSVPLTCVAFAADNLLAAANLGRADPSPDDHLGGASIESDVAYARSVADMYLGSGPIAGRVAEVGPGGSAAVALFLIAEGASHVDLVDRFAFAHDPAAQTRLYAAIIAGEPRLRAIDPGEADFGGRVAFHVGEPAAAEIFFRAHGGYDAICSCAVLEHLYDPLSALEAMASALRPGGRMVHQIDLRDHGLFSAGGHHDLTFLTVPEWFYPHMSRRRGRPNRVLIPQYRATLDRLPLDYELVVTHLVGIGPVDPAPYAALPADLRAAAEARVEEVRPKLARRFRTLAAADLAVSSFRLSARARS